MTINAIAFYLFATQAQGRGKLSHQSGLFGNRNLPDAEEAQHMINTIGIKELRHLTEAANPPLAAVLQHLIPIVGGEAPVLTIGREGIGWSSCLSIQIEVFGFYPSLNAVTRDTNGDIALQDNLVLTGIFMSGTHLTVEIILHEAPETGDFLISLGQRVGPVVEHGSTIEVTIVTELCIRYQPLLVLSVEILIVSSSAQRCPFLVKQQVQVIELGLEHALVVYLRQGIQLLTQGLKLLTLGIVLQLWHLPEIDILWVQGIDADTVIRITILPGFSHIRIVNRQYLNDALVGLCRPVNK